MACASSPASGPKQTADHPQVGTSLDFELSNLDGQAVKLSSYLGKVVLVDVWATWCKPCEASFPFYAELHARHQPQGFEIIAVSVDTDADEVAAFLKRRPMPFVILQDPEGTLPERLAVPTMPTAVLVGKDGKIRWVHPGFVNEDQDDIERAVVSALGAEI